MIEPKEYDKEITLDLITRDHIWSKLLILSQNLGSQKACAEKLGISEQYLCDIMQDRRNPGKKVLDALGYESITLYRKKR